MLVAWMGTLGLVLAGLGALGTVVSQRRISAALERLPEPLRSTALAPERAPSNTTPIAVIAIAVAIYLGARELGHGRLGLYACSVLLVANSLLVARYRIAWLHRIAMRRELEVEHRAATLLQLGAGLAMWVGAALWLLRP